MLSLFPLQFLAPLAYFVLRVCVGGMLIYFGRVHFAHKTRISKAFGRGLLPYKYATVYVLIFSELVLGALLIIGLYTQAAALGAMALAFIFTLMQRRTPVDYLESKLFYLLFFFVSLSIFITGAGAFAFDLPI